MKKRLLFSIMCGTISLTAFSQFKGLKVTQDGNVGIGTLIPNARFHVDGTTVLQANAGTLSLYGIDHSYIQFYPQGTSNGRKAYFGFGSGLTKDISLANLNPDGSINFITNSLPQVKIDHNGNVGIGTTLPENTESWGKVLEVKAASNSKIINSTNNVITGIFSHDAGFYSAPAGGITGTTTNHPFSVITNKLSRMTITNNGNVGIGTALPENTESWGKVLEVKAAGNSKIINSTNNVITGVFSHDSGVYSAPAGGITGTTTNHPFSVITNKLNRMTITNNGNVGIGTATPISKLTTIGSVTISSGLNNTSIRPAISVGTLAQGELRSFNSTLDDGFLRISAGGGTNTVKSYIDLSGFSTIPDMNQNIVLGTAGTERMRIHQNGKILINTTSVGSTAIPIYAERLIVRGGIRTTSIMMDSAIPADYVFQKYYTGKSSLKSDYKMPSLEEIEKFTKENHHLPEVPSAQDQIKNGVNVGEMSNLLLQKIEELTLYSIELNKENKVQKELIENLIERISKLENK